MLFYNQLKKEFKTPVWKRGQEYFRQNRVRDVRLKGDSVRAQVEGSDHGLYETEAEMVRGTIGSSSCTCSFHKPDEPCVHVAALCIWVVERGSLLRMGVAEAPKKSKPTQEKQAWVTAEPVAFVRGIFQDRVLNAVSVEPALRYVDPSSSRLEILPLSRLVTQAEFNTWKTVGGLVLKARDSRIPILESIHAAKIIWQGMTSLDRLADLLIARGREAVVFHESVDVEVDPDPLKLSSMRVGSRDDKSRLLTYEFANKKKRFPSEELQRISSHGKLSNRWLWADKLYRFETPLDRLSQYANRSGVAASEGAVGARGGRGKTKEALAPDGFGRIFDDGAEHALHPIALFRLQLELGVDKVHVDPEWKEYHEWLETFERRKIPALPKAEFGFDLRDYQGNGLTWLWSLYQRGLASLLADDMGLGKTHQVLALLSSLYRNKRVRPTEPTLVVAPTSVVAAWIQKLKKYETGLNWQVYHGHQRKIQAGVELVLTTYGMLQREQGLRDQPWHIVILDEAQAVKNATTISSRTARLLKSRFRVAMTGTPIENQSTDLWSIMEFLLPGYLGSLPRFKRLYGTGREAPSIDQASALKRLVSPFLLRRTKAQVLKELPEKTEELIGCNLTQAQRKAYRAALESSEAHKIREDLAGSGKIDYANVLALLTKLKQICDHPRLPGGMRAEDVDPEESGKWEALQELLREALGSNLKVVIFTQYLGMIDLITLWLKKQGIGYVQLRGDTAAQGPDGRQERLDRFANDESCRVFVCSLLAGGLGIDLTAASVCIHFDRWWNPAKENQATDRLHRIGQTRGVQVFKLQIPGTVEDRIAEIIRSKISLSDALIEESSLGLKAFSRQELLDLLTLPPEPTEQIE